MTVHGPRALAKAIRRTQPQTTPRRWALATVDTVTTGTAQVYLDGSATATPAFIPVGLTLAAGNVVSVDVIGNKAYIVARYS